MRPIDICGIKKVDAELDRTMNRRNRFIVIEPAVELRHPHTPKALRRNLQATATQFANFHNGSLHQQNLTAIETSELFNTLSIHAHSKRCANPSPRWQEFLSLAAR